MKGRNNYLRIINLWNTVETDKWSRSVLVRLFATPWTVAYQASPSMGFSWQEYWSGLPFPSPGDLPNPRIEPLVSHIVGRHFTIWVTKSNKSKVGSLKRQIKLAKYKVRELDKVRFRKRRRLALYRNRSPLMRWEGAAVRLASCCTYPRKE